MTVLLRNLLWLDCTGAAVVGVLMLPLAGWLSRWYSLPVEFVASLALVNLLYAAFSFSLASRPKRPRAMITLLVAANASWAALCLCAALLLVNTASALGLAHLVLEGLYVGWLARAEWRQREQLLTAA